MERENLFRFLWRRVRDYFSILIAVSKVFWEYQEVWLLTRKELKEKRTILAEAYRRYKEYESYLVNYIKGSKVVDVSAQEYGKLIDSFNNMVSDLIQIAKDYDERVVKRFLSKVKYVKEKVETIDLKSVSVDELVSSYEKVSNWVLELYEESMIRQIAIRRRVKILWLSFLRDIKEKRIRFSRIFKIPVALVWEVYWSLRFGISAVRMK